MDQYSALSAGQLVIMAVVVTASLAAWLVAIFLAARQPRRTSEAAGSGPREEDTAPTLTRLPSESGPRDESRSPDKAAA